MGAPWARVVNMDGNRGVAAARNEGLKHTKGKYVVWMDADDYWLPWFLERMVSTAEHNNGVIFSDIILKEDENTNKLYSYSDFQIEMVSKSMRYAGSSVLYPKEIVNAVVERFGGWDSSIPGMEDYLWQICVHSLGYCAFRIPEPLFVYRMYTSTKREKDHKRIDEILEYIDKVFPGLRNGEKSLCAGKSFFD